MKIQQMIYSVAEEAKMPGLRQMVDADVPKVRQLLADYLS